MPYAAELVQATDGNFYGTTKIGGYGWCWQSCGVVFKMTPAGAVTAMHTFDGNADGGNPYAGLIQATDGHLYGTTPQGGGQGNGTAFKITLGGTFTVFHTFGGGLEVPLICCSTAALMQATDGDFYGTAGASWGLSLAFKLFGPGGVYVPGTPRVLHVFTDNSEGLSPFSALIQATDGNFYGTAANGGAFQYGTVFKITSAGVFTVLHAFEGGTDGAYPSASLIQATDGNFHGTTAGGGTSGFGTVFRMTPAGSVTVLHAFAGGADGASPNAALIQATDGAFYGTAGGGDFQCSWSGSGCGTIFMVTSTGAFGVLHSLDGGDGAYPGALIQATDGNFYGTTNMGGGACTFNGAYGCGVVFKMTPAGAVTVLHTFNGNQTDGLMPYGALTQGIDGNFYGTTWGGGASWHGAAFRITPAGTFTVLHSFADGTDGATPYAGLIKATDGNFYGTTEGGGASGLGTVFRMTPSGAVFVLYAFAGADGSPRVALVQVTDGSFYGTTDNGGTSRAGTVFRLSREAVPFTDNTLTAGSTVIRAVHISELRSRIDAVRVGMGLPAYSWTDASLAAGVTVMRAQHILDLRTALSQAYTTAGLTAPTFADSSLTGTTVKAAHIAELRAVVVAIE